MGRFLAVTASRNASAAELTRAIEAYADLHSVKHKRIKLSPQRRPNDKTDSLVFPETNGWAVVLWPQFFNIHGFPAAMWLSSHLKTLISTIDVYDDECWSHGLFEGGVELDRFCSVPETRAEKDGEIKKLQTEWKGNPGLLASRFGIPRGILMRYLVHLSVEPEGKARRAVLSDKRSPEGKVSSSDEFEIEDFWVFTDFWRRLGIRYPDPSEYKNCIRFAKGWNERFPVLE